ncbi:MAG: cation diffusion facilitator family transporter [Bacillota bacterium]
MSDDRYHTGVRVSLVSLIVNIALSGVKAAVGLAFHSSALVADAAHSASDALSTLGVLSGLYLSRRPPDREHPYGHGKAETIATAVLSLSLGGTALWLLWGAVTRIFSGAVAAPGLPAAAIAASSILIKEILFQYTRGAARRTHSDLLLADAWHHRSDALSSVAALAGILGANWGWSILDPLAAVAVSVLILITSWKILRSAIDALMDRRPGEFTRETDRVEETARAIPGIEHVDSVRMRQYGGSLILDLEISVDSDLRLDAAHELAHRLRRQIEDASHIGEVFVHVNPHPQHDDKRS